MFSVYQKLVLGFQKYNRQKLENLEKTNMQKLAFFWKQSERLKLLIKMISNFYSKSEVWVVYVVLLQLKSTLTFSLSRDIRKKIDRTKLSVKFWKPDSFSD